MEVTGYTFKEAIKMAILELDTIRSTFDESLYTFEGDEKQDPVKIAKQIEVLEAQIAQLQTAQAEYNLTVTVEVKDIDGKKVPMSLMASIKLVGGMGRLAKMWRTAASGKQVDSWNRQRVQTRAKDTEVAQPTMKKADALTLAKSYSKYAASLGGAISTGNTTKLDIAWIDESLFA
jgi:hypothetical protein